MGLYNVKGVLWPEWESRPEDADSCMERNLCRRGLMHSLV